MSDLPPIIEALLFGNFWLTKEGISGLKDPKNDYVNSWVSWGTSRGSKNLLWSGVFLRSFGMLGFFVVMNGIRSVFFFLRVVGDFV
jgi:hypothetical protein